MIFEFENKYMEEESHKLIVLEGMNVIAKRYDDWANYNLENNPSCKNMKRDTKPNQYKTNNLYKSLKYT